MRDRNKIYPQNPKEKHHMGDLGTNGQTILKWILKK
jgi:hypothetical protein